MAIPPIGALAAAHKAMPPSCCGPYQGAEEITDSAWKAGRKSLAKRVGGVPAVGSSPPGGVKVDTWAGGRSWLAWTADPGVGAKAARKVASHENYTPGMLRDGQGRSPDVSAGAGRCGLRFLVCAGRWDG